MIDRRELPEGWDADIQPFPADAKGMASRASSGKVLNQAAKHIPWLLGGSADLAPSTNTLLKFENVGDFEAGQYAGRNFHFGIREHVMGAICNGMSLCGLRAFGATFFVFTDYMRPLDPPGRHHGAARVLRLHARFDRRGRGRPHAPADRAPGGAAGDSQPAGDPARPTPTKWPRRTGSILPLKNQPAALVLTRQNLPTLDRTKYASAAGLQRGGYVLADAPDGKPEVILIGTGSEVSLCVAAYEKLSAEGIKARVVSLPCWQLFDAQPAEYRDAVLPPDVTRRVAVELGVKQGWEKYIGPCGQFIGMCGFGASAPVGVLLKHFGFTVENVVAAAKKLCGK